MRLTTRNIPVAVLVTLLLCAAWAKAETVYRTANGKTFHVRETCMALKRAKDIYRADRSEAVAHGLRPCGICTRVAKPKTETITKPTPKNGWALKKGK